MATKFINFTKHAVAGSSKLKATTAGHIINIKIAADLDNGSIVGKGAYAGADYYAAAAPTTLTGKIIGKAANGNFYVEVATAVNAYLLLQVPMIYEEYTKAMQHESNFYNASGDICRSYELYKDDVFELSAEGFDGTPAVGADITLNGYQVSIDV